MVKLTLSLCIFSLTEVHTPKWMLVIFRNYSGVSRAGTGTNSVHNSGRCLVKLWTECETVLGQERKSVEKVSLAWTHTGFVWLKYSWRCYDVSETPLERSEYTTVGLNWTSLHFSSSPPLTPLRQRVHIWHMCPFLPSVNSAEERIARLYRVHVSVLNGLMEKPVSPSD